MLESTFFATHSSFMAMVGVAEQFGHVRNYLGQILTSISVFQTLRNYIYRLMGRNPPPQAIDAAKFNELQARPSLRPLAVFLSMVIGIPWLMSKLLSNAQGAQQTRQIQPSSIKDLDFCKAIHDFQETQPGDISLNKGDIVAILSKNDASGQPSQWWKGRTQQGRIGVFPANFVEIIPRGTED
jgi:peroxin-13